MATRYLAQAAPRGCWVIAHRGCSATHPENTMAAFKAAVEANADFIELDVHITGDGNVVVIHDAELKRTTDSEGNVEDMALADIRKADAGSWKDASFAGEKVPTLEEVFQEIPIGVKVEIKSEGEEICRRVLEIVKAADALDRVVISSFSEDNLRRLSVLEPESQRLWLNGCEPKRVMCLTQLAGPDYRDLRPGFVVEMHELSLGVWPWTVDRPEEIAMMLEMGVDGIISNRPDLVIAALTSK